MKNFPNTQDALETTSIIDESFEISTTLYTEWNINRYVGNPTLIVDDTIPTSAATEDIQQDANQIQNKFEIENVLKPGRGNTSGYVIQGTKYKVIPKFVNQRSRSESSWQNDPTWLWYDKKARFQYWVSALKANGSGALPYNTGRIKYTWTAKKPVNKIFINFQKFHAFPSNWSIYVDTTGTDTWNLIATNPTVPASGEFKLYRQSLNQPQLAGTWSSTTNRWKETWKNHIDCYGIKIVIDTVDVAHGRPGIIELSPRLEADMSDVLVDDWRFSEEIADQDFISPLGSASANTGEVSLANDTGLFNEFDSSGMFYGMMDEDVLFTGFMDFGLDQIPMFKAYSDSWNTTDFEKCTVQLVDGARQQQNLECGDMIISDVTAGSALHMMFAALGLPQFEVKETAIKQTPTMEKFYTRREDKVWEIISGLCKGLQMSMFFDAAGTLKLMSKEKVFNIDEPVDYEFSSELRSGRVPDLMQLSRQENSRFNKVTVRYNAINDYSLSGSHSQVMWTAPDPWTIGAAQIIRNVDIGDNYFFVDPNKPEDIPRFSGTVLIENMKKEYKWEGKQYYCKNASAGQKHVKATKPSDYWLAVERNGGEAPRFTGKVYLKDDATFTRSFQSKAYGFRQDWDIVEYSANSAGGVKMTSGGKHSPKDGCLRVETNYSAGKRLNITRKNKDWNRYDKIGMKFKVKSNDAKAGLVVWPQGNQGGAGYYFVVDPMTTKEVQAIIKSGGAGTDTASAPPPQINGFIIKGNGQRVNMDFDKAKDFADLPPLKVDRWSYLEVAIYNVPGGWEFEVYIDGQYCKTFSDTTIKLTRNERGGMMFRGVGVTLVDKFYVVNYPQDEIRSKNDDSGGRIVRRKDLWTDRKHSPGDKMFEKYLKSLDKIKKTQLFETDFSGRYHGIAREKFTENVRFDQPALEAHLVITNNAVHIVDFTPSSFGARMTLVNKSEKNQVLKGEIETKVTSAPRMQSAYIRGRSFRKAEQQEVEYKKNSLIDRLGPLPIEFESDWIQDQDTAVDIAKWVQDRFGDNAEIYSVEVFGNPLLEIADVVTIEWPEKGLEGTDKWCVSRIEQSWNNGLSTTVTVRRII